MPGGWDDGARALSRAPTPYDLTYDDVFMVPARSDVSSRFDVDLSTVDGSGTTQSRSSSPTVTAVCRPPDGRDGCPPGWGSRVLPQDIPVDVVRDVVAWVKSRHLVFDTALTLMPTNPVGDALALLARRAHGAIIVIGRRTPGRRGDGSQTASAPTDSRSCTG